jgi:hypothetical protein
VPLADADMIAARATTVISGPVPAAFQTKFGGLFFLINILIWMGLYPDFTRPLDRGLQASPFWLIAQLGRRFFGRAFARDPLCRWLEDYGCNGPLPRQWHIEPEWLSGISHPAPARQQLRWQRGFGDFRYRRLSVRKTAVAAGWIDGLAEFLKFRLHHAAHGFALRQLCLRADVRLSDDELLVRFSLADLPMALRMAGVDRNPGWLPAEGRAISFEFI